MNEYDEAIEHLKYALVIAKLRKGFCAPNPAVGAVVVKNNRVISEGYHEASGKPHAEVNALNALTDDQAEGATLYVTLEPCCHHGKTPPCTDLIIKKGIKRVFFGLLDPNPIVASKGMSILQQNGIECHHIEVPEIERFYQSYIYWQQHKKPFVTAKLALSLDGKIAGKAGRPIKLSGKKADRFTHQQRLHSDAILTTSKTIIQDNPMLNVRIANEVVSKPLYVLDRKLKLSQQAQIFKTCDPVTLFHYEDLKPEPSIQLNSKQTNYRGMTQINDGLCLESIINNIGEDGIHDLWIEAGGTCFHAFLNAGLINRAYLYVTLRWLGDVAQPAFMTDLNLLESAKHIKWHSFGQDAICELNW